MRRGMSKNIVAVCIITVLRCRRRRENTACPIVDWFVLGQLELLLKAKVVCCCEIINSLKRLIVCVK